MFKLFGFRVLATHAFNDSGPSTTFFLSNTFLLSKFGPPWQVMLSSTTFLSSKTFLLSKIYPPPFAAHAFKYNIPLSKTFLLSKFYPFPFGSPCFQVQHSFYQKHSLYQIFPPPLLAAHAFNDSGYQGSSATLPDLSVKNFPGFYTISRLRVYGLRFLANPCFQWFRFKYNIPFIRISSPLLAAHAFNDSGYQGSRGQPCFQVQEQPATSQHHAKHQANSPATLPIYCFQSTIPNRGRVTQHAIQPNIASKPANAPRRRAAKETRPHKDTVFCEPYPTTLSINDAENRVKQHTIQPNIALRRTTETRSQGTARNLTTPTKN